MKNKIINILIIFLLIIVLLVNNVGALTSKIKMEYLIEDGEIIAIVKLEETDTLINAISAKVEFDEEILNIDTITNLNDWSSTYSEENGKITLIKLSGTTESEEIFKIKFKIKDEEKLNDSKIILSDIYVSDGNEEENISDISVKLSYGNTSNNNIVNNTTSNKVNNTTSNKTTNTNNKLNKVNTINTENKVNNITNNTVKNNNTNRKNTSTILITNNKNENKAISNKSTATTNIPYAGIKNYVRIAIILLLTVILIVYIKYRKINKII